MFSQPASALICTQLGSEDAKHERPSAKARTAARWLQRNSAKSLTIDAAAESVQLSRRTLLRYFQDEFGLTPAKFLLQIRIDAACRILIDSELPVDKVARRVGMANGDHLAKVFRRTMGISPTCYRRLNNV